MVAARKGSSSQINGDMKHRLLGSLRPASYWSTEERLADEIQVSLSSTGGNGC